MKNKFLLLLVALTMVFSTTVFAANDLSVIENLKTSYDKEFRNVSLDEIEELDFYPAEPSMFNLDKPSNNFSSFTLRSEPIEKMPIGGGEYGYNPTYWNSDDVITRANCYCYALNIKLKNPGKLNPGMISGNKMKLTESSIYSCMKDDLKKLDRTIRRSSHSEKPDSDEYKIALVLDTKGVDVDFHYYRQDSDAGWSHKRGLTKLVYQDASNKTIWCPKDCDRDYGSLNYSIFANYYIVSKSK